jgi:hypothetical protein
MANIKLEAALKYAQMGLSIIPTGANKKSHIKWEPYQNRCATVEELNDWWLTWPDANPALVTGRLSGIVALDLDKKHNRTPKEFDLPPTAHAKSGSGGDHFFFKHPSGVFVKSASAISGEGVDSRGDGGYILLEPSTNEKGGKYKWVVPLKSKDDLAEMPEWFKKLTTGSKNDKKWRSGKDGVREGARNETAASMAGKIISSTATELLESIGWGQFKVWNNENTPPISEKELRCVWESIKKANARDEQDGGKVSQANALLDTIFSRKNVVLFNDEQSDGHIALDIGGHFEIRSCRSKALKRWLSSEVYRTQKKAPSSEVVKSILAVLEGRACFDGPRIKLHNRAAWHGSELWYDLTNERWQAVKINKDSWEITDKPPIIFKRYSHHQSQVTPIHNGDVKLFLKYINVVNPEHRLLLLVSLISGFIPDFPHAMLVVFGSQGSSKSTLAKLCRLVTDPSMIEVASFPHSNAELVQALAHHHFLFFDNVSYISEEQSDTLCKAITGGGHTKRALYLDDDDIIYSFMRCIGINGINLVTTRPDLLERSLLVELEPIESTERRAEKELYESFKKDLPFILGGVFDVLVKTIQIQPTIKIDSLPRMADWTIWGCAIAEALGYTKEEFLDAYKNNVNRQTEMLLNENIVAIAVIAFMEKHNDWRDTPTGLLRELSLQAAFEHIDTTEKYWPKASNSLSRKLNELSPSLKKMGILVTINTKGTERYIELKNITKKIVAQDSLVADNSKSDDTDDIIPPTDPEKEFIYPDEDF